MNLKESRATLPQMRRHGHVKALRGGTGYGPSMQACLPRVRFRGKACGFWLAGWDLSRTADLPILKRCEVFASDQDEAVVVAKMSVDGLSLL